MQGLVQSLESYLQSSLFMAYPTVFIGGLLTSFTPCVYPMIPIIVGYIGGQNISSRKASFFLSTIYVLGLSVTYSALGALSALTGRLFGEIQNNPWTFVIVGNIILIFGLSMLEVFTIPLPTLSWHGGNNDKGGTMGAFGLGLASGLVAAPCTAPVLGVLLTYVASKQNILIGISLLFVYAIGTGTLLVLAGTFTGIIALLPKSGRWMVAVQRVFGWFMIGLGEYFLIKAGKLWF
ncbi:sulfite exporter TauE/SafE family protein [bacterium]|nr:sulfite exporter TauE/SafE family protein [bacterium]